MSKKKYKLEMFSADEILEELRVREATPVSSKAYKATRKNAKQRVLAEADSRDLVKALRDAQKVIYGVDDRMDRFEIDDADVEKSARGVASLINMARIEDNGDGTSTIRTVRFQDAQNLCSGERFANQPTSAFCSGFLVGQQLLATAGHCVDNNNVASVRVVFGFEMIDESTPNVTIPNSDIYKAVSITARRLESSGADYAVIRLDRPVTDRPILPIRRTGKIGDKKDVYVIGHPSGLPMKYAPGAQVRDNDESEFFVANLDTYGGNSGSPVFNEDTHVVEGILVRGETDFVRVGDCRVSNVCSTNGCDGEDVTRSTEFAEFVPENDLDQAPTETLSERVLDLEEAVGGIMESVKRIEEKLE